MVAFFLGLSALFSYILIGFKFFPFSSAAFILAATSTLILVFKNPKRKYDYFWFGLAVAFSVFLVTRSNGFLTFVNFWASLFFTAVLAVSGPRMESLVELIFTPFIALVKTITAKNKYPLNALFQKKSDSNLVNFYSLGITLIVAAIIVPLLASANPLFNKLITDIFGGLLKENIAIHVVRLIFLLIFLFLLPRVASYVSHEKQDSGIQEKFDLTHTLLLPQLIVIGILGVFFVTQIQLYLSSSQTLTALGYTNSRLAREVFGQLIVVSAVIGSLIYLDKNSTRKNWIVRTVLLAEGIFLTAIAFKSVNDYTVAWGLTQKRLWGYAGVAWTAGAYALVSTAHFKRTGYQTILREAVAWSGLILVLVNLVNFDFLSYHYLKAATQAGTDYIYLAGLSSDSHSYKDYLAETVDTGSRKLKQPASRDGVYTVLGKIDRLKQKYEKNDWRSFNFSEYIEYKDVSGIDTGLYRDILHNLGSTTPLK